jgi:hypothetical protein
MISQRWSAGDMVGKVTAQLDAAKPRRLCRLTAYGVCVGPLAHQAEHLPFKPLPTYETPR